MLVLVFVLNLSPLHRYRTLVNGWQTESHALVLRASEQLARGCPSGRPVNQDGLPPGVLERIEARVGKLHTGAPIGVSTPVRNAICPRDSP